MRSCLLDGSEKQAVNSLLTCDDYQKLFQTFSKSKILPSDVWELGALQLHFLLADFMTFPHLWWLKHCNWWPYQGVYFSISQITYLIYFAQRLHPASDLPYLSKSTPVPPPHHCDSAMHSKRLTPSKSLFSISSLKRLEGNRSSSSQKIIHPMAQRLGKLGPKAWNTGKWRKLGTFTVLMWSYNLSCAK